VNEFPLTRHDQKVRSLRADLDQHNVASRRWPRPRTKIVPLGEIEPRTPVAHASAIARWKHGLATAPAQRHPNQTNAIDPTQLVKAVQAKWSADQTLGRSRKRPALVAVGCMRGPLHNAIFVGDQHCPVSRHLSLATEPPEPPP
jgi:hypothetical protein